MPLTYNTFQYPPYSETVMGETEMTNNTTALPSNELGVLITNSTARKWTYGVYALALIGAGATHVAYAALTAHDPSWLVAGTAVLTYLGIPVSALALANSPAVTKSN